MPRGVTQLHPMSDPVRPPTIAERRFAERAAELAALDLPARFARMYETNLWDDAESRSGAGSSLAATAHLRAELPALLHRLGVRRLLDVPCGDFHWMAHVDLAGAGVTAYAGGDIVEAIVARNRARYGAPGRDFVRVDLTAGPLPDVAGAPADAVLCRDCLVHLSFANVARALDVVRASGARWLITTTFPARPANADVVDGDWRPLNFERAPFSFSPPAAALVEECAEEGGAYADKTLAAWSLAELPTVDVVRRLRVAGARIERVDPTAHAARWGLTQYYAELARRFEHGFDPAQSIPADDADMRPPAGAFLVASADDEPVACGVVRTMAPGVAYLKRMWVADAARGLGVGKRMLRALEEQARALGMTTVCLETNRALVEAIAMYRRSGYTEVAPFNDEPYAHHWFEKRLDG